MKAEREWAYAHEWRTELDKSEFDRKKKRLMVRKLEKAMQWSKKLEELCEKRAEDGSYLESKAYACIMTGNCYIEKEKEWKYALIQLLLAK